MSREPTLLHIAFSPWSEKARWALEARGVAYRSRHYQPLFGEPELRVRLRRWRGPVTVPLLVADGETLGDSFAIARWAAARGQGPDLFPPGSDEAMARWNALSERGLAAGRGLSLARVLESKDALRELVPKPLRRVLGPAGPVVAAGGVRRTLRKYGATRGDHRAALVEVLDALRAGLAAVAGRADGARSLLPGHAFTYADIAMAQVLAFVTPPASGLRVGRHNRHAFTDAELAAGYADLLAWRDDLYTRHRGAATRPG
ncbi:MAG: glutathione S-transferase N-terminal domain-containing protein [Myxococcota bacterium]